MPAGSDRRSHARTGRGPRRLLLCPVIRRPTKAPHAIIAEYSRLARSWPDWSPRARASRPSSRRSFDRWVSPRRSATIADLQRGKDAGELRVETEPELLNDSIFGAIYYRLLLRSGPLTRRFGEELVAHILRGHGSGPDRRRLD